MKRLFLALGLTALVASGCTSEPSNTDKLEQADEYLSEHGGEPAYRAVAYDLYKEVLEGPDDQSQAVRAHFGVGMIGFLDLAQGLPRLLTTDEESEDSSGGMPPADALAGTIDALVHEVVDRGIVQHFEVVRQQPDFAFTFKTLSFPPTDPTQKPIVLSGEWDLTEINAIYGLLQTVVGTVELVYAYDKVPETVLTAALSGAELPEMPTNPSELPAWVTEVAKLVGLDPLPWLDPAFGKLSDKALLAPIRERFALGFGALETAMQYLQDESDSQSDDVFPKDKFLESILKKLLPGDDLIAGVVGGVIGSDEIEQLTGALRSSVEDETVFILPDFLWDLLDTLISKKPNDPIELHMPGVKLSSFFTNPITDLKDREAGLLPYYDDKGLFVLESEQEPWVDDNGNELVDDGEWEDVGVDGFIDLDLDGEADFAGRPGKGDGKFNDELGLNDATTLQGLRHKSPLGAVDLDNGIVDPAYLFFGDATFGGALMPITTGTETTYKADTTKPYTNADLMRLTSSLIWIIGDLDF